MAVLRNINGKDYLSIYELSNIEEIKTHLLNTVGKKKLKNKPLFFIKYIYKLIIKLSK